jgi:hypothetical protein
MNVMQRDTRAHSQELLRSLMKSCNVRRPKPVPVRSEVNLNTFTPARAASAVIALVFSSFSAFAATPLLFPQPLHLTRAVDDPGGKTTVVDEYCRGNTVISIAGDRTVIADYEKQTVTQIDRAAGTYSVTPFTELAKIATPAPQAMKAGDDAFTVRSTGPRAAHAGAEYYEAEAKSARTPLRKVETGVDRSVHLSRDAAEVLAGAAYPRSRSDESEILLRATAPDQAARRMQSNAAGANAQQQQQREYGLAVDQTVTYQLDGRTVVIKNRITHVGHEQPPAQSIEIPAGAHLIESAAVQALKELQAADRLPSAPSHK